MSKFNFMRSYQYLIKPFSENAEQQKIVNYLKARYPNVKFTTGLLGIRLPKWAAWLLIALGYGPGTPDLMIFKPKIFKIASFDMKGNPTKLDGETMCYHGLFIEIKNPKHTAIVNGKIKQSRPGTVADNQKEWQDYLNQNGYKSCICYGAMAAEIEIEKYLK